MPKGGFGNLIALPLQGRARKEHNSEFVDEFFNSYHDQWEFLYQIKRITAETVDSYLSKLQVHNELGELAAEQGKPWEKKQKLC